MSNSTQAAEAPARPSLLLGAAHLVAVWSLAFLQPMLSLLGKNPDFFVARGNTTGQIILYALVLAFVPPLALVAIEALVGVINKGARWIVHLVFMTLVTGCFFLTLIQKWAEWPAGVLIAVSLVLAALCIFAYARWPFPRTFVSFLIPAPIIILIVFFCFSNTSKLILPREQPDAVDVAITKPAPVVMIIFDEFPLGSLMTPADKIDPTRYPAFADLASTSTWYKNVSASAAYTPLAVPAILTGRTPGQSDLPIAADHPRNILTLLGKTYKLRVMEEATHLCTEALCPGSQTPTNGDSSTNDLFSDLKVVSKYLLLPDSLQNNLPDISTSFGGFAKTSGNPIEGSEGEDGSTDGTTGATGPSGATGVTAPVRTGQGSARALGRLFAASSTEDESSRVNDFNSKMKKGQNKTLDLIHIEKPHYPWRHLPDGQRYTNLTSEWSGLLPNDGPWEAPPKIVDIALQRHLLEVGYSDTLLGLVEDRLKKLGLWDKSLVVVTADHGAGFKSRVQRRAPTPDNLGQIGSVPLFIKAPGQTKPAVVSKHTCATDTLPRVAGMLGIDYPWDVESCPANEVKVLSAPTGEATVSLPAMVKQRQAFIEHINTVYGTGHGWAGTYRFGPLNEIIGRPLKDFAIAPLHSHMRADPERPNLPTDYDPQSPVVFALLQRGVLEKIPENKVLAVSVNGRIAAVGWSFKDGSGQGPGYSILLPPETLKKGYNDVRLYLVKDKGNGLQQIYPGNNSGRTGATVAKGPDDMPGPTGATGIIGPGKKVTPFGTAVTGPTGTTGAVGAKSGATGSSGSAGSNPSGPGKKAASGGA